MNQPLRSLLAAAALLVAALGAARLMAYCYDVRGSCPDGRIRADDNVRV